MNLAVDESIFINGAFFSTVIVSSLVGAILSRKISRTRMLEAWMIVGCAASVVPFIFSASSESDLLFVALLFGLSFGVGMPACLALFSDSTVFENRGTVGGATFLATNLGAVVLASLISSLTVIIVVSLVWRVAGLCVFLLLEPIKDGSVRQKKIHSFKLVLQNRGFVLYAVPWLIFSLIDRFARIYAQAFFAPGFLDFNRVVEPILGIIFVFLGGFFADRIGRKRIVIYGFVALGIAYASIGLAPYTDISTYFYTFVDGIAWGIFMVVFMLILWGDLSLPYQAPEMYYTLGSVPFFLSDLSALFFTQYTQGIPQGSTYAIFSIAAFFLFLAVLPLMYAPETLPERKIQEKQIKKYLEEAKKVAEKETGKKEA